MRNGKTAELPGGLGDALNPRTEERPRPNQNLPVNPRQSPSKSVKVRQSPSKSVKVKTEA